MSDTRRIRSVSDEGTTVKPRDFPRSLVVHFDADTRDPYLEIQKEGHGEGLRVGETRLEATYTLERVIEVCATVAIGDPSVTNK